MNNPGEFNIIYTPGSVRYLSFFVRSLLKWTPASFRMVSNGCLPQEQRFLARFCRQEPRLEYWAVPTKASLPHGHVLNYLQAMTRGDYFCFMDSDIFAAGDFSAEIEPYLSGHTGVFGGMPIWVKADEEALPVGFQHLTGMFNRTADGLPLGSTYFAIYKNEPLTELMQSSGVGFEAYLWPEIPADGQTQLRRLGLNIASYDTGKVLNLLLLADGCTLANLALPSLYHIGGASFQVLYDQKPKSVKNRIGEKLSGWELVPAVARWRRARTAAAYRNRYAGAPQAEFALNLEQRVDRRTPTRQYFLRLLHALYQGAPPPPPLVTGDLETDEKARVATAYLLEFISEFSDRLQGGGA